MSRPIFNRLCVEIERDAAEAGVTPEELIFGRVIGGESPKTIMAKYGVSRPLFYQWIHADKSGQRMELYHKAQQASADAHADTAGEVLEDLNGKLLMPVDVQLANSKSNYHRWLAEVRDRERYGQKPTAQVNVSIGSLHLDALRRLGSTPIPAVVVAGELPAGETVEAELVEE